MWAEIQRLQTKIKDYKIELHEICYLRDLSGGAECCQLNLNYEYQTIKQLSRVRETAWRMEGVHVWNMRWGRETKLEAMKKVICFNKHIGSFFYSATNKFIYLAYDGCSNIWFQEKGEYTLKLCLG